MAWSKKKKNHAMFSGFSIAAHVKFLAGDWWETVLCIVECPAAPRGQYYLTFPSCANQNGSRHCKMST